MQMQVAEEYFIEAPDGKNMYIGFHMWRKIIININM